MTTPHPRIKWKPEFRPDHIFAILFVATISIGIAGGLWVGYRTGGWMWLAAPAVGVLWALLLTFGTIISFVVAAARGAEKYLLIVFLVTLTYLGLLGYFAYWALSTF